MTSHPSYNPGIYAAVDIGTVTCRLLIASIDAAGNLQEIVREINICNLGVGVDKTHRLSYEALERTVAVLSTYSRMIEEIAAEEITAEGPATEAVATEETAAEVTATEEAPTDTPDNARKLKGVRTIATSASRDAENASDFQERIAQNTSLKLEVIPGTEEAALSFKGASSAFPGERVVVIDIGGGSTEIVAGWSGEAPAFAHSFDIGCRRITERFLQSDPPTQSELQAAREFIATEMAPYLSELKDNGCFEGRVVAVAGTATSAVSMRDHMAEYDPQKVHGSTVSRVDIDELLSRLASLTLEERKHVVGLEPDRAGVVVAGLLIMQTIMEQVPFDSFTVSEFDILQGIILDNACTSLVEVVE